MYISFKTEINPTEEQAKKIKKTIGVCRYVYNLFISKNNELYKSDNGYISGREFSVWLNNVFVPENPDKKWIKEVSSKAVKQSIEQANTAYMNFFNHGMKHPKFKKKSRSDVKMYFVRPDKNSIIKCERHRIKIPTIGWVKIKEKGYIPTEKSGYVITSGTVSIKAGRFFVSVNIDVPEKNREIMSEGIGIDIGITNLLTASNGMIFKNINNSPNVNKAIKRLKKENRKLSRKYLTNKNNVVESGKNIEKQIVKVQKAYQRIDNIRTDYINKIIYEIVKTKPSYIAIEDLEIYTMYKEKYLTTKLYKTKLYDLKTKLIFKSKLNNIECRVVDRWFPSSKMCHGCGKINDNLKLSDRIYLCECGYSNDRDFNASLNLRDCNDYVIL